MSPVSALWKAKSLLTYLTLRLRKKGERLQQADFYPRSKVNKERNQQIQQVFFLTDGLKGSILKRRQLVVQSDTAVAKWWEVPREPQSENVREIMQFETQRNATQRHTKHSSYNASANAANL